MLAIGLRLLRRRWLQARVRKACAGVACPDARSAPGRVSALTLARRSRSARQPPGRGRGAGPHPADAAVVHGHRRRDEHPGRDLPRARPALLQGVDRPRPQGGAGAGRSPPTSDARASSSRPTSPGEFLSQSTAQFDDRAQNAALQATVRLPWLKDPVPYKQLDLLVADEKDAGRRAEIEQGTRRDLEDGAQPHPRGEGGHRPASGPRARLPLLRRALRAEPAGAAAAVHGRGQALPRRHRRHLPGAAPGGDPARARHSGLASSGGATSAGCSRRRGWSASSPRTSRCRPSGRSSAAWAWTSRRWPGPRSGWTTPSTRSRSRGRRAGASGCPRTCGSTSSPCPAWTAWGCSSTRAATRCCSPTPPPRSGSSSSSGREPSPRAWARRSATPGPTRSGSGGTGPSSRRTTRRRSGTTP